MLSKAQREELSSAIAADARTLRLSNATVAWFLEHATPGQMQAVAELFAHEIEVRRESKHARLLRQARFPAPKSVEGFDPGNLEFQEGYGWERLLAMEWLSERQDFVFHGPTGRGKTHLAIALGMLAVGAGKSVRFLPCAQLVFDLKAAMGRGRLDERYQELSKVDLLVLDEFGYIPLDSEGGRLLFQVMSNCYERQSMVITTNIEFGKWGSVLADDKLASALVDRVVHHGRLVEFGGESRRVADSLMLGNRKEGEGSPLVKDEELSC